MRIAELMHSAISHYNDTYLLVEDGAPVIYRVARRDRKHPTKARREVNKLGSFEQAHLPANTARTLEADWHGWLAWEEAKSVR